MIRGGDCKILFCVSLRFCDMGDWLPKGFKGSAWRVSSAVPLVLLLLLFFFSLLVLVLVVVRKNETPLPLTVPLVLLLLVSFLVVVVRVQAHALVLVLVLIIVRSNTTPLLLARATPMSILIPVSAHLALCVYMMYVLNYVWVGV